MNERLKCILIGAVAVILAVVSTINHSIALTVSFVVFAVFFFWWATKEIRQ